MSDDFPAATPDSAAAASAAAPSSSSSSDEQWKPSTRKTHPSRSYTSRSRARPPSPLHDRRSTRREKDDPSSSIITPLAQPPNSPSLIPRWSLRSMWELASLLNFLNYILMDEFAYQFFMHLGMTQMAMSLQVSVGRLCIRSQCHSNPGCYLSFNASRDVSASAAVPNKVTDQNKMHHLPSSATLTPQLPCHSTDLQNSSSPLYTTLLGPSTTNSACRGAEPMSLNASPELKDCSANSMAEYPFAGNSSFLNWHARVVV